MVLAGARRPWTVSASLFRLRDQNRAFGAHAIVALKPLVALLGVGPIRTGLARFVLCSGAGSLVGGVDRWLARVRIVFVHGSLPRVSDISTLMGRVIISGSRSIRDGLTEQPSPATAIATLTRKAVLR